MPYDEALANRVRIILPKKLKITEKKMFGGLCFLLNVKMCCGIEKSNLVVRVGPQKYEAALKSKKVRPMDFTGKPLKGFVYIDPKELRRKDQLRKWVHLGVTFARSLSDN